VAEGWSLEEDHASAKCCGIYTDPGLTYFLLRDLAILVVFASFLGYFSIL